MEALEPFKAQLAPQDPKPLPYLDEKEHYSFDINLDVAIKIPSAPEAKVVAQSNFKHLYWSINQ